MSRQIRIAAAIWGLSILASRVIGLVREMVIGRVLGTDRMADVYMTSFVIPDFLNYLLAAGALSLVFIPMFGAYLSRNEEEKAWEAFSVIASFLSTALLAGVVGLWIAMPALVGLVAPGFTAAEAADLVRLSRIILPAQIFHVLGGLLSAALLARDRHALPALAPLVYSGAIVAGGLLGRSADGFAWGALAGSALGPFALPLAGNWRSGMRWRFTWRWRHPDLATYLWRMLPVMLAFSIVMVDDWFVARLASYLDEGAVAALRYAKNLIRVPMGVFGMAAATSSFPTLARLVASGNRGEAYRTLASAVRALLVLALASQVVFTVAGPEISRVLFGARIAPDDHRTIGNALAILCLGLWAWVAQAVITRGFYALGRTWFPSLVGTAIAAISYPLYRHLAAEAGVLGLPIATSIAISLYVAILVVAQRRDFPGISDGYGSFALRIGPALALGIAAGLGARAIPFPEPLVRGAVAAAIGGSVYLACGLAFGPPEVRTLADLVRKRLGQAGSRFLW